MHKAAVIESTMTHRERCVPAPPIENAAIVQINVDGTASLYLGDSMNEYAYRGSPGTVLRVLLDYTATLGRNVTILTRHSDGRTSAHELRPTGTVAPLLPPRALRPEQHRPECRPRESRLARLAHAASELQRARRQSWAAVKRWLRRHSSFLVVAHILLVLAASITVLLIAALLWMQP
jgi:hypothetical protein